MGKGDRKTKKGKINKGTYGVRRPKKNNSTTPSPVAKKTVKKAAPKKATKAKKPAVAKEAKTTKAEKETAKEAAK